MLAVTDAAAEAINSLVSADGQQGSGGLRFAVQAEHEQGAALVVGVAQRPEEGDEVVTAAIGARVYMAPEAASYLDDKILDVQPDSEGQLSFALADQA